MRKKITYQDECDRSYGLTGMAISLAVFNNGEKIMDIDIDRSPEPIGLAHDFFFSGNPRCSAKMVWDEMAENFHLALAMAIGNLLSRKLVHNLDVFNEDDERELKAIAINEGAESCGLERDEVNLIWEKDLNYLRKVFQHPSIQRVVQDMASEIQKRRIISRQEINEILSVLNRW